MLARMDTHNSDSNRRGAAFWFAVAAIAIIPINTFVWFNAVDLRSPTKEQWGIAFLVLAILQLICGIVAFSRRAESSTRFPKVAGGFAVVGAIVGGFFGFAGIAISALGGAWGRPLRIRGRQLHPSLREGSDWTFGDQPNPEGLDDRTREALAALWWHDAQKEHASVPAFARVSWLLAAAGAPAELLEWSHRAAIEEISHTRACFALAAGYAGHSRTVEPMPDLLLSGLSEGEDPRVLLAKESLSDGCQLEDFNADVAAACAEVCQEPVTKDVLERIAREERTHADFSWAVLEWLASTHGNVVAAAIDQALAELDRYPRPTAVSFVNRRLVESANVSALRAHGRLSDEEWGRMWQERLVQTKDRVEARLRLTSVVPC